MKRTIRTTTKTKEKAEDLSEKYNLNNNYPKIFTLKIDEKMDRTLTALQEHFQKQNRADVFRLAVSLLNYVREAEQGNKQLMIGNGEPGTVPQYLTLLS
jgi:hypothetical protein